MSNQPSPGLARLLRDAAMAAAEEEASDTTDAARSAADDTGDPVPSIPDDRLLAAIRHETRLTPAEQREALLSIAVRQRIAKLRFIERLRAERAFDLAEISGKGTFSANTVTLAAAAAPGQAAEPIRLQPDGCTLDLLPIDADGAVWRLELLVHEDALAQQREQSPAGLRVVDTEDLTWLIGRPDDQGRLAGFWCRDEPLHQRLQRVKVAVRPA